MGNKIAEMKIAIILVFHLILGCRNRQLENNSNVQVRQVVELQDSVIRKEPSPMLVDTTLVVSYAAISCSCPQWFDTKYRNIEFLEGVDRFYLEPSNDKLINANKLWDGINLPLTIKITGRFLKDKGVPKNYFSKTEPILARIFRYESLTVITPHNKN